MHDRLYHVPFQIYVIDELGDVFECSILEWQSNNLHVAFVDFVEPRNFWISIYRQFQIPGLIMT